MNEDKPQITFGRSAEQHVLDEFGWDVRVKDGALIDEETGEPVKTYNGHEIRIDQFGGVVEHKETGEPVPLNNNIVDIIEYAKNEK